MFFVFPSLQLTTSSYVSWAKWTPIMQSYMDEKASYFATPAVGLVFALDVGLQIHLAQGGVEQRFREHARAAAAFRAGLAELGLRTVATSPELSAATLTAIYYPENVNGDALRGAIKNHGAIVAGGLHATIGAKYFRVGHMGYSGVQLCLFVFFCFEKCLFSVYGGRKEHLLVALKAIEKALAEQGYTKGVPGSAAAAFESALQKANM